MIGYEESFDSRVPCELETGQQEAKQKRAPSVSLRTIAIEMVSTGVSVQSRSHYRDRYGPMWSDEAARRESRQRYTVPIKVLLI